MRVGEAQSKNRDGVKVYSQTLPDILSLQGSELGEILSYQIWGDTDTSMLLYILFEPNAQTMSGDSIWSYI